MEASREEGGLRQVCVPPAPGEWLVSNWPRTERFHRIPQRGAGFTGGEPGASSPPALQIVVVIKKSAKLKKKKKRQNRVTFQARGDNRRKLSGRPLGRGSLGSRRDSEEEEQGDREALPTFSAGGAQGWRGARPWGKTPPPLAVGKAEGSEMPGSCFLGGLGAALPPSWLPSMARLPSPTR